MMRILAARAAIGLAAAALVWSASAQALGLGEVEVRSHLNERFSATIPLVSASADDLDSLVLSVASPEEFARSGVDRADAVGDLSFIRSGNGIRVSSREPIRDPFLTFIVEARWNGGRLLREYTVLLDPPGRAAAAAPVAPQITVPAASPSPSTAPPVVVIPAGASPLPRPAAAPAPSPAAAAVSADGRYGPVQPGQTLWSVARALLPDSGVSHEQMVLALYQGNPQAFVGGDIDQLLKGSRLKVPTAADAGTVDAATARARVAELRKTRPVAAADAPLPAPVPAPAPAPVIAMAPAPVADVAPAPTPAATTPAAEPVPAPAAEPPTGTAAVADPLAEPAVGDLPLAEAPGDVPAEAEQAVPPPAAEPVPAIENRPAPTPAAPAAADEAPFSWPLVGGLLLLILALIAVKLRSRKAAKGLPAPRRVGNVVEPLAAGADVLMESPPRNRPLPAEDDEAKTVLKPLLPAADATAAEAPAAESSPERDTDDGGLPALGSLDAADPMTEADFHLAYGLYDEAAQMLKTAIAADPARSELKVKLAEVWSAAGNADEFRRLAEGMAGKVSAAEWQKVSTLGRAILPDLALFRNDEAVAEPAAVPSLPMTPPADALRDLSVIDFDLDSEAPSPSAMPTTPVPAIEPRLRSFDEAVLPSIDEAEFAPPPSRPSLDVVATPAAPPAAANADADLMADLDLSSFDLDDESLPKAADPGRVEFTMADLDAVADEPLELDPESEVIGDDEVDTKLGLARVYADMGDDGAARALLDEVLSSGTDKQQQEARALRQRLAG